MSVDETNKSAREQRSLLELLSDPLEGPFLLPFFDRRSAERPPGHRLDAYREWLVARGDIRGELLTAIHRLTDEGVAPAEAETLRARVIALIGEVDSNWWAVVRPNPLLLNCGLVREERLAIRFAFRCSQSWESLALTEQPRVRHCSECGERVYEIRSRAEAEERARAGSCISVPANVAGEIGAAFEHAGAHITGRPAPPHVYWSKSLFGEPTADELERAMAVATRKVR